MTGAIALVRIKTPSAHPSAAEILINDLNERNVRRIIEEQRIAFSAISQ
jgi:hypothetical protein